MGRTLPRLPRLEVVPWGIDLERFAPETRAPPVVT